MEASHAHHGRIGAAQQRRLLTQFDRQARLGQQAIEDRVHRVNLAAADVIRLAAAAVLHQQIIGGHHVAHIGQIAACARLPVSITASLSAALDGHHLPSELRRWRIPAMARPDVVERPGDHDVQPGIRVN